MVRKKSRRIAPDSESFRALREDLGDKRQPPPPQLLVLEGGELDERTAVARELAGAASLPLYRVDLGQVVSKYIGETEKNLHEVFSRAAAMDVVLLLDEADALFEGRTEVKDAHDRYANQEVNFLLQRIESFQGLAILSTNRKAQIAEGSTSRSVTVIEFARPGEAQRRFVGWLRALPQRIGIVKSE